MVNFQERFIGTKIHHWSCTNLKERRVCTLNLYFCLLKLISRGLLYSISHIIIDLFDNSNQEFYIFDRDVADGPYFGRTHPIRLVSLMVFVYEDRRLYDI